MKKYLIIILFFISSGLSFSQFYFISEEIGWFGGLSKKLYKTTDGCKTWSIQNIDSISFIRQMQFIDDSIGFFYTTGEGNNYLYHTSNKGNSWKLINRKNGFLPHFLDEYNGYSIGSSDSILVENQTDTFYYQRLLKTTDGGITWDSISFIEPDLNGVIRVWVHNMTIINVIMNTNLYKTTNTGQSWFKQITPTRIGDFWYIDSLIGFIFSGNYGTFKTTDGGNTWSKKNNNALKIVFSDSTTLFGSLYNTYLFKSTNRGETWFELRGIETSDETYNYYFLNKDFGFAIQYSGGIAKFYRTTDGGYTWTFVGSIPNVTSQEENNITYQFSLGQNYPNPFNPSTKIKYTLPKKKLVTIKIYDVLGKEIAQIVNEEKPSGEYEVDFNGSKLSSGIYYYKIQAGEFVQTKKMVLMK